MIFVFSILVGCGSPTHLQYDFGRATYEAQALQADLSRASVVESIYPLSGPEAEQLRLNVLKATTEEKTGRMEAILE